MLRFHPVTTASGDAGRQSMGKQKKASGKGGGRKAADDGTQAQAERLGKSISESAQQIWLAGMGAFHRAQAEGGKLFESLVRDGLSLEQTARKFAGHRAEVVREMVEDTVGQARERAAEGWDKLEKAFEERVHRALLRLDVPRRDELDALARRVERLTADLRRANGPTAKTARAAPDTPAARPAATRRAAAKKAPARKASAKKPAGAA